MRIVFEHLGITLNGRFISSFEKYDDIADSRISLWMTNGVRYLFSGSDDNIKSLYSSLRMVMDDTDEVIFNREIKSCHYGTK